MKKRILALLAGLILLFTLVSAFPASAIIEVSEDSTDIERRPRLDDSAELLSEEEREKILAELDRVSEAYGFDVVIVTTNKRGSVSIGTYANSYYHSHGYGDNGIILAVDMSDRSYYEFTHGYSNNIWTSDYEFERLENKFVPYLSSNNYYKAFTVFIEEVEYQFEYNYYEIEEQIAYDNGTALERVGIRAARFWRKAVIIGIVAGAFVAWILTWHEKKKLTSVAFQKNANAYVKEHSFRLNSSRDIFLYRTVSKTARSSSSGGGGGGHSHGGGSGSHGGHGGHFCENLTRRDVYRC